ncbi:MAG: hypothetical protein NT075_12000 [Chloroflexi bacterium]|nr:hypothetical protein [Chloroflexota bacterium]
MGKITITLNDDNKINELLALIAALPYVDNARFEDIDEKTDSQATNAADHEHSPFYQDPQTQTMDKEIAAFETMKAELIVHYLGRYVAIFQGAVVDCDADKGALLDRIVQSHPHEVVLVRYVRRTPRPPFRLRSPRLNRN